MNLNNIDLIKHNGSEIELIKWNGFILYQKNQEEPDAPEIPLYQVGQFKNNSTITEVRTMVNESHIDLSEMFKGCAYLESVNTQDWNTSNITDMDSMFSLCYALKSLDLSSWDTSKVTNMNYMFYRSYNLTEIDMRNFKAPSVGQTDYVFYDCRSLHTIRMDNCDNGTIKRLIDNQDEYFPTNEIEGITRKIYLKQANITDKFGYTITPPENWEFIYVD